MPTIQLSSEGHAQLILRNAFALISNHKHMKLNPSSGYSFKQKMLQLLTFVIISGLPYLWL